MNRREFVKASLLTGAAVALAPVSQAVCGCKKTTFHAFTKNFMFLDRDRLCELMAGVGFEGIEWCVRGGGHVDPLRVRVELPLAVEAARKQGLKSVMVCTRSKGDGTDPAAEGDIVETLKVCAAHGVRMWRPGGFVYDKAQPVAANLEIFRRKFHRLEEISRLTGVVCAYQNHLDLFGGAVFDLWSILSDLDPSHLSIQYDIMHAAYETPVSWERILRQVHGRIASACLKDCLHLADMKGNLWDSLKLVPAPSGCVPFEKYARVLKDLHVCVPHSVHYEFPLPQDDAKALSAVVKRELDYFKGVV